MSARRRILAIVNPISGSGRGPEVVREIARRMERSILSVDLAITKAPGEASALASRLDGYDAVIACGGDGTVNEVVNGLREPSTPMLVVPCGTGNALGAELGMPRSARAYVEILRRWRIVPRDLGVTSAGRRFTCFAGAGFDAECARRFRERREKRTSYLSYAPTIFEVSATAQRDALWIATGAERARASYALAAISPCYAGPIRLIPHADPRDGRLDVMAVSGALGVPKLSYILCAGIARRRAALPSVRYLHGAEVQLTAAGDEPVPFQVDGDFVGYLPAEIRVLGGALRLIV